MDGCSEVLAANSTDEASTADLSELVEGRGCRCKEPFEGKMARTESLQVVSTRQERIAELARRYRESPFTTLAHHIDVEWLREAYRRTRKDGAVGVDGQTAQEYAESLEQNLQSFGTNRA